MCYYASLCYCVSGEFSLVNTGTVLLLFVVLRLGDVAFHFTTQRSDRALNPKRGIQGHAFQRPLSRLRNKSKEGKKKGEAPTRFIVIPCSRSIT